MTQTKTFAKLNLKVQAKVWDRQPMVLHTEVATGTAPNGKEFRIIQSMGGGAMFIQLDDQCYEIGVRDIMDGLFDAIKEAKS